MKTIYHSEIFLIQWWLKKIFRVVWDTTPMQIVVTIRGLWLEDKILSLFFHGRYQLIMKYLFGFEPWSLAALQQRSSLLWSFLSGDLTATDFYYTQKVILIINIISFRGLSKKLIHYLICQETSQCPNSVLHRSVCVIENKYPYVVFGRFVISMR